MNIVPCSKARVENPKQALHRSRNNASAHFRWANALFALKQPLGDDIQNVMVDLVEFHIAVVAPETAFCVILKYVLLCTMSGAVGLSVYVYTRYQSLMDPKERRLWRQRLEAEDHSTQEAFQCRMQELDSSW